MATTEGGYNPISYHNGSVWPHDTSLIVAGLMRYGFVEEAARLTGGLLDALDGSPDHRLPEVLAGYGRGEAPFPVDHPLASRPQAWAAGSTLLLLTSMAGFDASVPTLEGSPFLPVGVGHLAIEGLWHGSRRLAVRVNRARQPAVRGSRPTRRDDLLEAQAS
jgi:glycogen debranching enzyme